MKTRYFYDDKFHRNKSKYIIQCLLATVSTFIALLCLNVLKQDIVVIASIGASVFIVFTMPHTQRSATRYVFGGYIVGIIAGVICYAMKMVLIHFGIELIYPLNEDLFGALAIGLAMFAMVIFNLEHPPAAGLALGLINDDWSYLTIVVTLAAILLILAFRQLLRKTLINLL